MSCCIMCYARHLNVSWRQEESGFCSHRFCCSLLNEKLQCFLPVSTRQAALPKPFTIMPLVPFPNWNFSVILDRKRIFHISKSIHTVIQRGHKHEIFSFLWILVHLCSYKFSKNSKKRWVCIKLPLL